MGSLKRRLRGLITRECISKGIDLDCIDLGIERGEYLLDKGCSVPGSVRDGIAAAVALQRLAKFRKRPYKQHAA